MTVIAKSNDSTDTLAPQNGSKARMTDRIKSENCIDEDAMEITEASSSAITGTSGTVGSEKRSGDDLTYAPLSKKICQEMGQCSW